MIHRRTIFFAVAAVAILPSPQVSAQSGLATQSGFSELSSEGSLTASPGLSARNSPGVKLSESNVLHAGVGASAGYDSNVFYTDENRVSSPLMEVVPFIGVTNLRRGGGVPGGVLYDLGASLQYREYLSDDENVRAQRAFNPMVTASLQTPPARSVSFGLSDQFTRQQEPPYGPSTRNITRDYNLAQARLRVAPGGGRLAFLLQYSNALELFENEEYDYANVMGHEAMLEASWRWLPKTGLFLQVSQGAITYLNEDEGNQRFDSYPLKVLAGIRGLVTTKVAVNLGAGYAASFYEGDVPDPEGISNLAAVAELLYSPLTLTRIVLGYRHEFRNSPLIGTHYDLDTAYFGLRQMVASRVQLGAYGRYEWRRYRNVQINNMSLDRNDRLLAAGGMADYFIQQWFYTGVSYSVTVNDSDLELPTTTGLDYVKHQVFGRIGIAY